MRDLTSARASRAGLELQAVETCEVSTNIIISTPSVVSCDMQVPFEEREQIPFEKEEVPFEEREQVAFEEREQSEAQPAAPLEKNVPVPTTSRS